MTRPSNFHLLPFATVLALATGCAVEVASPPGVVVAPAAYVPVPQAPVVSIFIDPPLYQLDPLVIGRAPPPMLVEVPPPLPFVGAVWTGGYWAWHGDWVWSAGRWAPPPQPGYSWVHPYYEHRGDAVIFIDGHWGAPGVAFVPPPPSLNLSVVVGNPNSAGPRPIGPAGVFVPAPPGSRPGIIVPAPVGTPPAVVVSAPPVTNTGMRIQSNSNNTTINNTSITNVTVVAPAGATASGHAFQASVPAQAHLAAALPPVVHLSAPSPGAVKPVASYVPSRQADVLPPPQPVRIVPAGATAPPTRPAGQIEAKASPSVQASPESKVAVSPTAAQSPKEPTAMAGHDAAKPEQQREAAAAKINSHERTEVEKQAAERKAAERKRKEEGEEAEHGNKERR